jgi:hypothetical protein
MSKDFIVLHVLAHHNAEYVTFSHIVSQFDVYNKISFLLHRYLSQNDKEVNIHLKLRYVN